MAQGTRGAGRLLRHLGLAAACIAGAMGTPGAQGPARPFGLPQGLRERPPAAGMLLVAARTLGDPNFAQTVVLLTEYTAAGAVGLVLNRQTDVPLTRVFPAVTPFVGPAPGVFQGGPVEVTTAQALRRGTAREDRGRSLADDLQVIGTREALEAQLAEATSHAVVRVYLGYAVWSAGQLEAEIAVGAWHVFPADTAIVFDATPDTLWARQIRRTEWLSALGAQGRAGPPYGHQGLRAAGASTNRSASPSWYTTRARTQ